MRFITLLALLFPLFGIAQNTLDIEKEPLKFHRKFHCDEVFKLDNGDVIFAGNIIRQRAIINPRLPVNYHELFSDFVLYKYSANMKLKEKLTDNMELDGKRMQYAGAKKVGHKYYVFFSFSNRKMKKNFLFAREIDVATLKLADGIYKVAEVPLGKNKFLYGKYNFSLSPDGETLLISYENRLVKQRGLLGISYITPPKTRHLKKLLKFNYTGWSVTEDMVVLKTHKNMSLKTIDSLKRYTVSNGFITDAGLLLLFQNRSYKMLYTRVVNNRKFVLALFNNAGDTLLHFPALPPNHKLSDLVVTFNPKNNNIVIGGPYTTSGLGANGVYFAELDKNTLQPVYEVSTDFDPTFTKSLELGADSIHRSIGDFRRYNYDRLYIHSAYGHWVPDDESDLEPDIFESEKKPKGRKARKNAERKAEADAKIALEAMRADTNAIATMGKAVSIVFNTDNQPILLLERQSYYTVIIGSSSTTANGGHSTPISAEVKGFGDIVIAALQKNNAVKTNYLLKYHGVDKSNRTDVGFVYTQNADKLYLQYGIEAATVNLLTTELSVCRVPYLNKKFKKYFNKTYLTIKPIQYLTNVNGVVFGVENKGSANFRFK
jgi:hypothetical protein